MGAADLIAEIEARRDRGLMADAGPWPRTQPIPSDLSECTRAMVLSVTHWRDRPAFEPFVRARLMRGTLIEDAVVRELSTLGFIVRVERLPFEITDRRGRVVLRGKLDGFIQDGKSTIPFECKSVNPNVFQSLHEYQDLDRFWYTRRWPRQIQAYLYAENQEEGILILDDCLGHWRLFRVPIDLEMLDQIIRQCEETVEHAAAQTLPGFHDDPSVCAKCWCLNRVCFPPLATKGYTSMDDPELVAKLERREAVQAAHREYEALDREVKERFRGKDGVLVGDFLITGKETPPRALPKEPAKAGWRCTIERIGGTHGN